MLGSPTEDRSVILALLAAVAVLFGTRYVADPAGVRTTALMTLCHPVGWGATWIAAGVAGLVAAWLRVGPDLAGFAPMLAVAAVWSAGHWLTLTNMASYPDTSAVREAALGIMFLIYATLVATAAQLPETRRLETD